MYISLLAWMEEAKQLIISNVQDIIEENAMGSALDFAWPQSWLNAKHVNADTDFFAVKENVQIARAVKHILEQMVTSVVAVEAKLKKQYDNIANKRCFSKIPDEILGMILEYACYDHDPDIRNLFTSGYSMVSHRFRDIMLCRSSIWSNISSTSLKTTRDYLSVGSTAPVLSVIIFGSFQPSDTYIVPMYKTVLSVSARIRTMRLKISSTDLPNLDEILATCNVALSFPFLISLELAFPDPTTGRTCQSMCKNWELPALKNLDLVETIPELDAGSLSRITSCSLYINKGSASNEHWRSSEIIEFVLSLSAVEELEADVWFIESVQLEGLKMDTVRELTLGFSGSDAVVDLRILEFISFPSISSLKLKIALGNFEELQSTLNYLYHSLTKRMDPSSINHISLSFGPDWESTYANGYEKTPFTVIGHWCQNFRRLDSFVMENDKKAWNGLFSFAGTIDALELRNLKSLSRRKDYALFDALTSIPTDWKTFRCTHQKVTAVLKGRQITNNSRKPLNRLASYVRLDERY